MLFSGLSFGSLTATPMPARAGSSQNNSPSRSLTGSPELGPVNGTSNSNSNSNGLEKSPETARNGKITNEEQTKNIYDGLKLNSACERSQNQLWGDMTNVARTVAENEPFLAPYYHHFILSQSSLIESLATVISFHLASVNRFIEASELRRICIDCLKKYPGLVADVLSDLNAVLCRDPAVRDVVSVFLYFKGFQSIQAYRISHILWLEDRKPLALMLQSLSSMVFSVDIHPAAKIGPGLLIDHAHSVVIGETAVIGSNCTLFHETTLGGTGKEHGDRHPKLGNNVLIGAGAKVFGNIRLGNNTKVAGGSVVLADVPDFTTVAGIPAKVVGKVENNPASSMDMSFFMI